MGSTNDDDKPDRVLVAKDRVFERTQGCWNCVHGSRDEAKKFWSDRRQQDLAAAMRIAMNSRHGENDIKVKNIRHMVDTVDHGVACGAMVRCTGRGETADGKPVGDLVANTYLCHRWSAAVGASIARAGQKADELPEEIMDKIDNVGGMSGVPDSVQKLLGDKKVN